MARSVARNQGKERSKEDVATLRRSEATDDAQNEAAAHVRRLSTLEQPTISTHVLDTQHGTPARGVPVALYRLTADGEREVGSGTTDSDGRIRRLLSTQLEAGEYVIEFHVGGAFFLSVRLAFRVDDVTRSYHVPLLVAPYSVASYRGS